MNYIENIYICLAAPLLIALLCLRAGRRQMLLFLLAGMTACLLSSYISTFLVVIYEAERSVAAIEIAPVVEELMKMLPVVFYLLVFEPPRIRAASSMLMVAAGFSTFENVCFLITNGASDLMQLVIRGFGTGAMHIGTMGLLCLSMIYHAIFNLLVQQDGAVFVTGALFPVLTGAVILFFVKRHPGLLQEKKDPA